MTCSSKTSGIIERFIPLVGVTNGLNSDGICECKANAFFKLEADGYNCVCEADYQLNADTNECVKCVGGTLNGDFDCICGLGIAINLNFHATFRLWYITFDC